MNSLENTAFQYRVTQRKGRSYVVGKDGCDVGEWSGPWRYSKDAQDYADELNAKELNAMNEAPRRWVLIEEWEPDAKVEIIVTGCLSEDQLQAIEGFVTRERKRMATRTLAQHPA